MNNKYILLNIIFNFLLMLIGYGYGRYLHLKDLLIVFIFVNLFYIIIIYVEGVRKKMDDTVDEDITNMLARQRNKEYGNEIVEELDNDRI